MDVLSLPCKAAAAPLSKGCLYLPLTSEAIKMSVVSLSAGDLLSLQPAPSQRKVSFSWLVFHYEKVCGKQKGN